MWIEIIRFAKSLVSTLSLPLRECGLKYRLHGTSNHFHHVTPLAGVWIEMIIPVYRLTVNIVTPLAGVWIEMC